MDDSHFMRLVKPDEYQVFLFTCPATRPFSFARHPWLVVNKKGNISRWEIFWRPQKWETAWGHLHKDFYAPAQGIARSMLSGKHVWERYIRLEGIEEGDTAKRMAEFIEKTPETYPYCSHYVLKGPNSNTYVAWVLRHFPESKLRLPWRSFGKGIAGRMPFAEKSA